MAKNRRPQPLQPRTRLDPQPLGQHLLARPKACSASAWRPLRYRASISWPHSRSRNGCSSRTGRIRPTTSVCPQRQRCLKPPLQRVDPQRLQPGDLRADPAAVRQALQWPSAPQRQRPSDQVADLTRVAYPPGAACPASSSSNCNASTVAPASAYPSGAATIDSALCRCAEPRNVALHGIARRHRDLRLTRRRPAPRPAPRPPCKASSASSAPPGPVTLRGDLQRRPRTVPEAGSQARKT